MDQRVANHELRREALNKWKSGLGKAATYRALIQIFLQAGKVDYAEFVCDLLKDDTGKYYVFNIKMHIHVPCQVTMARECRVPLHRPSRHMLIQPVPPLPPQPILVCPSVYTCTCTLIIDVYALTELGRFLRIAGP